MPTSPKTTQKKTSSLWNMIFEYKKLMKNNGVLPGRVELQRPASLLCFSREAFGTSESHANCFSLEPKVIYPKYYKHSNKSCTFAIFETYWTVRVVLKISSMLLKFILLLSVIFFIFSWQSINKMKWVIIVLGIYKFSLEPWWSVPNMYHYGQNFKILSKNHETCFHFM